MAKATDFLQARYNEILHTLSFHVFSFFSASLAEAFGYSLSIT